MIEDAKQAIDEKARSIGANALVVGLAIVSLSFFTVAAFVWAEAEYGAIAASLGLGLLFAIAAAAFVLAARIRARRFDADARSSRPYLLSADARSPETNPEWWIAPVGIATGIEVLRRIGAHRLIPAFALSAVLVAALQSSGIRANKKSETPK
ncbi:MAG: hypothetical protein C3F11_12440 [Methylocystaceae bacterium]|nr:MAG: hypothetical protein C3F11_12440 [Methylocystaceae bacterium]